MPEELNNANMSEDIIDLLTDANLTLGAGMASLTMALASMAVDNDIPKLQVVNAVVKAYERYNQIRVMGVLQ